MASVELERCVVESVPSVVEVREHAFFVQRAALAFVLL